MRTRSTPQLTRTSLRWTRHTLLVLSLSFLQASVVRCSALPDANSNLPRNNLEHTRNKNTGDPKRCPLDFPLPPPHHHHHQQQQQQQQQQQPPPNRSGEMAAMDTGPEKALDDVGTAVTAGGSLRAEKEEEEVAIPERFVIGCNGDRVEAARRWKETCEWRKENNIDQIIETPQPRFFDCREVFPVYLHGRSKEGLPVLWERIGKVDLKKADELKLPLQELTPNYVFLNECIWRVVLDKGEDDNDDAKFITVEDVGGVRLWHLTPRVLTVLRTLTGTMKAHYVERCHKSYIINAPGAFTALWRIVSGLLDARTRSKISILGTNFMETMQQDIDISQIPAEYGGQSGRALDDSDDERKIQALIKRLGVEAQGGKEGGAGQEAPPVEPVEAAT